MISCLNNLVGVRGLAEYENPDWTYINDLQGITTTQLEAISDQDDHYEPRLAWEDIYSNASRLLEADIRLELKKYFKGYTNYQGTITAQYYDEKQNITSTGKLSGWFFDFGYESKHKTFKVDTIDLYLNTAENFTIYIYNANTGDLLDSFNFTGSAQQNTYRILKEYPLWKYPKLFIGYDEDQVSTIKNEDYDLSPNFSIVRARMPKGNVRESQREAGDTGLIVTYNLECSIDNFVCQRIDLFKDPFLYKLGIQFCNERLYSDRINRYTLMDRGTAEQLREDFTNQYNQMMDSIFSDIRVESDGICFECSKAVNYKAYLP